MLKRIRHVLLEEISIRERVKVSVFYRGQDLDFISFELESTPRGIAGMSEPNTLPLNFNLKILSIKNGMSEPNNQSPFARLTRSSVHN